MNTGNLQIITPVFIAFAISVVLCPILIPLLKRLKFGQEVRDDGPKTHLKKEGTPTMGGVVILIAIAVTCLFYMKDYPEILPILFVTIGFGLIGFLDDFIKIVMKRSLGLRAWQKMLLQIVVAGVFAYYVVNYTDLNNEIIIPFTGKIVTLSNWAYVLLLMFVVVGTVNGSNFTDGLDGLASSVTALIATFFTVVAIGTGSGVAPVTCAAVGALLGFLVFNVYPAKVFMGDTGSLALGGFVAATAYMLKMPLFIVIVAFIYLAEVLSVIIQVVSFKTTGKRVFKMAPIHHHFELCGWPESKVVAIFDIVTALLCVLGLIAL
ncbi:phospho-N-acetylmuramoyl-pentapeptide-transferase [Coprococcus sp. CAG:782]|jgi:phospho-N-acetylmuramoyl-pentapeptide-transferase|uniref:phospho-N-acetylmuramoyl-pentapeptide- transferase n=1 Tax=Coprococcus sp. OM04-5BH TaxID=2293093 RepID=UPI00033A1826|nr:phospho-N-acetylmuramoyl-pentapeptide-transferase [Coprococcus sp. OM04-5BH]MEE0035395.1 phospho-N-acetylmuramoyl-pentapeptide-transferase [Coprococcus sp.]RHV31866.1 phospho-N-acetylmuramoyl-pentapeptide-transferase [Coprococcus sp. OM04-5BH]CCY53544.1 phospho-N-acetylmuramoyl-pentapeptide-transferase [Coprococcus sp. CAG:782]